MQAATTSVPQPSPQIDLFAGVDETITARFRAFHAQFPQVYALFERFTLQLVAQGHTKVGARMIVERIRWENAVGGAKDSDGFKINNMFIAHYARLFIQNHPQHKELFELRKMQVL